VSEEPIAHWPGGHVSLGDYSVYVRSLGKGEGEPAQEEPARIEPAQIEPAQIEPALCLHGLGGSSRNWTDLMDLLRARLACDALDLPGFGDSPPRPDGRYSIAALAQTVTALIERRYHGPPHLIANSLGGAVAVKVAATRPDLVRTLTLISPALPDSRPRLDLIRFPVMSLPRIGPRLLRKYEALPPPARVADVITTCYCDPARFPHERFATEVTELARRDTLDYPTAALVGVIRTLTAEFFRNGFFRNGAWRDATRITAPTLVIYGSHDRLVDPRMAGRAAHAFRGARIVVLPRTGHLAHMEHPVQVAAEIDVLLRAQRVREFPFAPAG
jgi:pimeloyl-ACP methyl ester carboxylesterase